MLESSLCLWVETHPWHFHGALTKVFQSVRINFIHHYQDAQARSSYQILEAISKYQWNCKFSMSKRTFHKSEWRMFLQKVLHTSFTSFDKTIVFDHIKSCLCMQAVKSQNLPKDHHKEQNCQAQILHFWCLILCPAILRQWVKACF